MRKVIGIITKVKNSWMNEVLGVFLPLLHLLALDNEFFNLKQNEFVEISESEKQFLHHPFHMWFQNVLKNVIILDSQAVYDTLRDLFLNRIALRSPNCLECPDDHGCCHSTYSLEHIDYKRIVASELIDPTFISRSRNKYKVKFLKDKKGRKYCGALDIASKKCLIHRFKPPTCCKYPLISNIHDWSDELMAWTRRCAHAEDPWVTRVHPAIMNVCRDLWVDAQLLWESGQNFCFRLQAPINKEVEEILSRILAIILSRILAIKQCSWPYKTAMVKRILLENYSESNIQLALQLVKKV